MAFQLELRFRNCEGRGCPCQAGCWALEQAFLAVVAGRLVSLVADLLAGPNGSFLLIRRWEDEKDRVLFPKRQPFRDIA